MELINRFCDDLKFIYFDNTPVLDFTLQEYFNCVKNIPFRRDPKPIEIVARPYLIFKHKKLGMDCKKKSVLIGSYCAYHNIPFRLVISSKRADKKCHHIFVQVRNPTEGQWKNVDATYPENNLFEPKRCTYMEVVA
jgi:hypothetical protein